MSVCSQCVKTIADSKDNFDKTFFLNLSDSYIQYDVFDSDQSVVESNIYEERNDISSDFKLLKIN